MLSLTLFYDFSEMTETMDRKKYLKDVKRRQEDVERRKELLRQDISELSKKELVLNAKWRYAKKQVDEDAQELDTWEHENPQLPMVVGRKLNKLTEGNSLDKNKLPGNQLPHVSTELTMVKSKLEILKAAAQPAHKAYKAARKLDIETWALEEEKINESIDMERMYNKMADIEDRLKRATGDNLRADLVGALNCFRLNKEKLHKVQKGHSDMLKWWGCRTEPQCTAVLAAGNRDQGVLLGESCLGVCQGRIVFPKHATWELKFTITKQDETAIEQGDPNDSVVIRIGGSLQTLSKVGVFAPVML
jgi:hypothetical protein